MAISITRRNPRTGRTERPWRNRDGLFVLGDPAHGAQKHHDRFAVKVGTLDEVADLVQRGFSVRMTDGESPPSLIAPDSLTLETVEADADETLWANTQPRPPFGKAEMFEELKKVLFVQASQIAHAGRQEAAIGFLGFQPRTLCPPYDANDLERLDLRRFRAATYVERAYDYGFQVEQYLQFGDAMAQDSIHFLEGANPSDKNGETSPLQSRDGRCRIAIETALARWQLSNGFDVSVRGLALLASMTEAAVRNSLSKERIPLERGQVANDAALGWLKQRRSFIPTRTGEDAQRPHPISWMRGLLDRDGLAKALPVILQERNLSPQALARQAQAPDQEVAGLLEGHPSMDIKALQRIGQVLELDVPHFVGIAIQAALRKGGAA